MSEENEYPNSVARYAKSLSLILIGTIGFAIIGGFIVGMLSFWSAGGSLGWTWNMVGIFFGILAITVGIIFLLFISTFLYKRIYLWALDFIYMEIKKKEMRKPLEEEKIKHRKQMDKRNKLIKTLEKRNQNMFKTLLTYEENRRNVERELDES
jgi:MFS family permease